MEHIEPDLVLIVSVMTLLAIIYTHLSTKKMLEHDEHRVVLLIFYSHVKCALHLSWILARKRVTISGDIT